MRFKRIVAIVLTFVCWMSVGGVAAAWVYADGPISPIQQLLDIGLFTWVAGEDQGDQTTDEKELAGEIVNILNDMNDKTVTVTVNGREQQMTGQDAFEQLMDNRKDEGSSRPMNEMMVDDPNAQALRELLGIADDTEITAVIKFVNATSTTPGYELYTTRVDVNAKDANGNYIIPKANITNENYYIYPVNKITFVKDSNGDYIQNNIVVGYSRAIWYYEDNNVKYDGNGGRAEIRTFDVTQWKTGASADDENAIKVEKTGELFIYSDIGQIGNTNETAIYFRRANWSGYGYSYTNFAASGLSAASVDTSIANGTYSFVRGVNGSNQYAKMTYTPGSKNPSASNPNLVRFTC